MPLIKGKLHRVSISWRHHDLHYSVSHQNWWPIYAPINWAIIGTDNAFQVIILAICDLLLIGDWEYFSMQLE